MDLVIMAAGMGSRFGGLKQIEPIDKHNNFIIDYSIYDAIKCGFDKVIFIIKKENLEIFKNTVGNRIEQFIDTKYVFQDNSKIPPQYKIPETRKKPLGTTQAVLCAAPEITDDFVVINSDDFYGYDAFKKAAEFLKSNKKDNNHASICYEVANTMSDSGTVKRGVCAVDQNSKILGIAESVIQKGDNNTLLATPLDFPDIPPHAIPSNTPVAVNMFGFKKSFLNKLQVSFDKFLEENKDNLETAEKLLPSTITEFILDGSIELDMVETSAIWHGITYKADKEKLVAAIQEHVKKGEYPENLWANLKTME